jgi:hypothetical protein
MFNTEILDFLDKEILDFLEQYVGQDSVENSDLAKLYRSMQLQI